MTKQCGYVTFEVTFSNESDARDFRDRLSNNDVFSNKEHEYTSYGKKEFDCSIVDDYEEDDSYCIRFDVNVENSDFKVYSGFKATLESPAEDGGIDGLVSEEELEDILKYFLQRQNYDYEYIEVWDSGIETENDVFDKLADDDRAARESYEELRADCRRDEWYEDR